MINIHVNNIKNIDFRHFNDLCKLVRSTTIILVDQGEEEEEEEEEGERKVGRGTRDIETTYGWRKCSKSQARRMLTERSGRPRWGRHASCSIIPIWCRARCCRRLCSRMRSRGVSPLVMPVLPVASFSPSISHVCFSCAATASLRHRKCLDIAFCASAVYGIAAPNPIAESNEFTTICICSQ